MAKFSFFFLLISTLTLYGQNLTLYGQNAPSLLFQETSTLPCANLFEEILEDSEKDKDQINQQKGIGDTLYYEDFASSTGTIPSGWSVVNNVGNSNNWIWSNTAPGGQYSANTAVINSTSASNGFISLPSDYYNTPFPIGGPDSMDTYIQSNAIPITPSPSVYIVWQQSQRYCCSISNELVVEVSNNGVSWTTYDATLGRGPNTASPNPTSGSAEIVSLNVSPVLANQTSAYIRFRSTGNSHYYWMIDDLLLIEGYSDAMVVSESEILFSGNSIDPKLTIIPQLALNSLKFKGVIKNEGSNTQTGVGLKFEIFHDQALNGNPGLGLISSHTQFIQGLSLPGQIDTLSIGPTPIPYDGNFRVRFSAVSSSVNQKPIAAVQEKHITISDTVLAKDSGVFVGSAGVGALFAISPNNGDRWGSLISIGDNPFLSNTQLTASSLSIHVSTDITNIGSTIMPKLYSWNNGVASLNQKINLVNGFYANPTVITSQMLGNWITLPFNPIAVYVDSQYVVGWEQVGGSQVSYFTASRARSVEPIQPPISNFMFINDSSPSWGWTSMVAAIRLNFKSLPIGYTDNVKDEINFSIYPNPNQGLFYIEIEDQELKFNQLSVRNSAGQLVYKGLLKNLEAKSHPINIEFIEKGIYFIILESDSQRLIKRMIVN